MKWTVVVAMSLVAFVLPNVVGFAVWNLCGDLPDVVQSLAAIMGWVLTFGLSAAVFWGMVTRGFLRRSHV